jgi:undecaprenyl pyrophosphate phosphatase UppP
MANRSYEQKVLETVHKKLQQSETQILARRWVLIVLWIFLVLFLTLVFHALDEGYLSSIAAVILAMFVGVVISFVHFYHRAEREWPFWSPHLDGDSIEERLNTINKDAKAQ